MKKIIFLLFLLLGPLLIFAQQSVTVQADETLRSSNKIYVVVTIIAIIFIGISLYLFSIDRRLKKIEKEK